MQLKISLLILFLCTFFTVQAQEVSEKRAIELEIKGIFESLKVTTLQEAIPYKIKGKIGFVNAKTKKRILKPTENFKEVSLANPHISGIYKEYRFKINSKNFEVYVLERIEPREDRLGMAEGPERDPIQVISSKDGYKGFKVNNNGILTAYSDLYYAQSVHNFNVQPFLFEGKRYAIATKQTGPDEYFSGIIDEDGNTLPHFNFNVKCLTKVKVEPDDIWFSIGLCRAWKGSLVSFKGKIKFKDELLSSLNTNANIFKYNHNHDDKRKTHGIFDVENLEWVLKPQTKWNIKQLGYTSNEYLNTDLATERPKATIYFLVEEGKKEYYMDFNHNKYLP